MMSSRHAHDHDESIRYSRMSVRNFLRRQVDASGSSSRNCDKTEVETRPLSEYDNLVNFDKSNFPLVDIQFRFDDLSMTNVMMNSSNSTSSPSAALVHNNNESSEQIIATPSSSQQLAAVHHKYQNVLDTLQQRRNNDSNTESIDNDDDQQVDTTTTTMMSQSGKDDLDFTSNSSPSTSAQFSQRKAISDAKSLFFGLNNSSTPSTSTPLKSTAGDELDKLIEDIGNAKLLAGETAHQYVNFPTEESKTSQSSDKTPSASGSSSTTATPSATPTRQDKIGSRKNSESSSSRSKSPKFMLPESTGTSTIAPTQAIYMSTTVPLNIKGHKISGRHKPTRQSLRHSRMIVTTSNKSFQGSTARHNLLNIRYVWLAKFVLTLKIVFGISILVLGAWICLFANSTPIQQNPFWAGLILIASGLLGHYLLTFRRTRSKLKAKFFWFLKANAAIIIILSVFCTTLALIYASFHYISISSSDKKCFPENVFVNGSSCICEFNVIPGISNSTRDVDSIQSHTDSSGLVVDLENAGNIVHFKDLSCSELTTWTHILLASMILNFIGLCLSVIFMTQFVFGCKRRRKYYSNVRSDP